MQIEQENIQQIKQVKILKLMATRLNFRKHGTFMAKPGLSAMFLKKLSIPENILMQPLITFQA